MTSKEFVIWLKGFTEACNDFTATPKQWDRIKEVLDEVEYDQDIDEEVDDYRPNTNPYPPNGIYPGYLYRDQIIGTISTQGADITFSSSSSSTSITNLPTGTNITYTNKQQLND